MGRIFLALLLAGVVCGAGLMAAEGGSGLEKMKAAPINQWVIIDSVKTGGRHAPLLVYDRKGRQVVRAAGQKGGHYSGAKLHFDTEYFSMVTGKWTNAYPDGTPYKALEGPTDAPAYGGGRTAFLGKDKNGLTRIKAFGNSHYQSSRIWAQYAFDYDQRKIFFNAVETTAVYDFKTKAWSKRNVPEFNGDQRWSWSWGSLCYDGHNKELLAFGGSSGYPGGACGTWRLAKGAGKWQRVISGSPELQKAHKLLQQLRADSWSTFSRARNKYYSSETKTEEGVSLQALARALSAKITGTEKKLGPVKLSGKEAPRKNRVLAGLKKGTSLLSAVSGKVTIAQLDTLRAVFEACQQAEFDMSPQPPSRGFSQMAYDAKSKKIVLFGGITQSSVFGDTWIYDTATRTWEPSYPKQNPSPRGGHAMLYLPKGQKVAMIGGFTVLNQIVRDAGYKGRTTDNWVHVTPQIWTYNVTENKWDLNYQFQTPGKEGKEFAFHRNSGRIWHYQYNPVQKTWKQTHGGMDKKEYTSIPLAQLKMVSWSSLSGPMCVAVTENDQLLAISTGGKGRNTYYMKFDASKKLNQLKSQVAVAPGLKHYSPGPKKYYKNNIPDAAMMKKFYADLPENQWTKTPVKNKVSPNWRSWGTVYYDVQRNQLLWWGGGHVTWLGTDTNHFHFNSGVWSVSDDIGIPISPDSGFLGKVAQSLTGQPHIPVHQYQAYAYDPTCGRMVYLDRAYDVAARAWIDEKISGYKHIPYKTTVMYSAVEGTAHGVYYLSDQELKKYDPQKHAWVKVPWKGPDFGRPWCDGTTALYDSKRECIWFANNNIFKYNIKDGQVTKIAPTHHPVKKNRAFGREAVYVPELDMIMVQPVGKSKDGKFTNILWDPKTNKFYQVALPWISGGKASVPRGFGWSGAVHYDPANKTVIQTSGIGSPYVIRFNRKTLKMTELKP
jgi:Galactose oxidase, central domain